MKTVIIYKSFLGITKKYARWMAEELHANIYKFDEVNEDILENFDLAIVASGTYAAHMPLVNFLKKYWSILSNKKVIVLGIGMAPADDQQAKKAFETIPAEMRAKIFYFKLPGKLLKAAPDGEPSREKLEPVFKKIKELYEQ
jgi:menaquinone-dependent protoporphyrinogen IX oxidase